MAARVLVDELAVVSLSHRVWMASANTDDATHGKLYPRLVLDITAMFVFGAGIATRSDSSLSHLTNSRHSAQLRRVS